MPDWDEDSSDLINNLKEAFRQSRDQAFARTLPTVDLARGWHATTMTGLAVPDQKLVGRFRGESGLEGYGVRIGKHTGVRSTEVAAALQRFERTLQRTVLALDQLFPQGGSPSNQDELNGIIELCAWVHAEWVRIHPFANGNGRTARIWAGYVAMRYGLPPFVRLRPRPDDGYADACSAAMAGSYTPTAQVFRRMYLKAIA
jgi:Fic/DOC family